MMLAQPNRVVVVSITKQETCLYLLVQRRIEATYLFLDLGTTWSHFGRGSVCMGGTSSLEVLLRPYALKEQEGINTHLFVFFSGATFLITLNNVQSGFFFTAGTEYSRIGSTLQLKTVGNFATKN